MTGNFRDRITYHEDRIPMPVDEFVSRTMRMVIGMFPPRLVPENVSHGVHAVIDDSRWIVHCSNPVCGGAQMASQDNPYFVCVDCGSPENQGKWYNVVYPAQRDMIEALLLQRDHTMRHPDGHLVGRGWEVGQTLTDLRKENAELGIAS